jgi:hypothetical protein
MMEWWNKGIYAVYVHLQNNLALIEHYPSAVYDPNAENFEESMGTGPALSAGYSLMAPAVSP